MAQKNNKPAKPVKTTKPAPKGNKPAAKPAKKTNAKPPQDPNVTKLKSERDALQKKINQSQGELKTTNQDVQKGITNLTLINDKISQSQRSIERIQLSLDSVNKNIRSKEELLKVLEAQLKDRKAKYIRSLMYLYRNRNTSNKLLFILSANSFQEMFRRYRYVQDYSKYQRLQGELVAQKQQEINHTKQQLNNEKNRHNQLLGTQKQAKAQLSVQQSQQQSTIADLQKHKKELEDVIAQDRKAMAALNSKIDYYVKQAIEQERKRREAQLAAEKKRREEKAAADKKRREAQAAADKKRREEKAAADKKRAEQKQNSRQQQNGKPEKNNVTARVETSKPTTTKPATTKPTTTKPTTTKPTTTKPVETKPVAKEEPVVQPANTEAKLGSNFAANKGRFPMPITGSYSITVHFGSYTMPGTNVRLDSKGIDIAGNPGAQARCIYGGEVTAVFSSGGMQNVMVRHGSYISIYCNLSSVTVSQGQSVSAGKLLGAVARDGSGKAVLHFQLRKEGAILNPESWLAR